MTVAAHIITGVVILGTAGAGVWLVASWYWPTLGDRLREWRIARSIRRQRRELRRSLKRDRRTAR